MSALLLLLILIGLGIANASLSVRWLRLLHRYRRRCPMCRTEHRAEPLPQVVRPLSAEELPPGMEAVSRMRARLILPNGEEVTVDPVVRVHSLRNAAEMRFCLPDSDEAAEIPAGATLEIGYLD